MFGGCRKGRGAHWYNISSEIIFVVMSRIVRSSHYGSVPIPVVYAPPEPHIYCPVCHIEYPQSQTDSHIMRHTIQSVRFASKKEEQVSVSTQPSKHTFIYPMVEPL